ncbi:MAG: DNA-binding protein [Methanomassiliicoccales archaeon]
MKYTQGKIGRIFVLRLEDGEILHEEVERFAADKRIEAGIVTIVGAANKGSLLIVGPDNDEVLPILPMEQGLDQVFEMEGVGTIFLNDQGKPVLHMHIACGRAHSTVTGCVRKGVRIWKVAEVVIVELTGINARRELDVQTGFELLKLR